jgi:outer membrane protein OmpA-like peptidoglycan-associated protein
MKRSLVAAAVSCFLFQAPLMAQTQDQEVEKSVITGSMIGVVVGTLLGGAPGVVLGMTGGAMLGELGARKEQVEQKDAALSALKHTQLQDQLAAAEHQALYQRQREMEYTRLEAVQQGYTFCLGFRSDSAEIEAGMGSQLKALVVMLQAFPELTLQIRAGADARGGDDYNKALSKRRAEAVAKLLIASGLQQDRMRIDYIGKASARYPIQDIEGLAYDRMVQLTLVKGEAS